MAQALQDKTATHLIGVQTAIRQDTHLTQASIEMHYVMQ